MPSWRLFLHYYLDCIYKTRGSHNLVPQHDDAVMYKYNFYVQNKLSYLQVLKLGTSVTKVMETGNGNGSQEV
jgi:hypothetical protein